MTKKKVWQIAGICCLCVCVLMGSVLGVVFGMNHTTEPVNLASTTIINDTAQVDVVEFETTLTEDIDLCVSSAVTEGDRTQQRITATVYPTCAINKEVDWSLVWVETEGDFEQENDVYDFLDVTPDSDGSTSATITVLQSFSDHDIAIVCTTRVGNKKAATRAHYIGIPTILDIVSTYNMPANSTIGLPLTFDNDFGDVTEEYLKNYADFEVTVTAVGFLMLQEEWVSITEEGTYRNPYVAELSDLSSSCNVTATIVDGKLQLKSTNAIEAYWRKTIDPPFPYPMEYIRGYVYHSGAENCYWYVRVVDKYSGVSCEFSVTVYAEPENVFMDDDILF